MKKKKVELMKMSQFKIENLKAIKGGERRKTSANRTKVD